VKRSRACVPEAIARRISCRGHVARRSLVAQVVRRYTHGIPKGTCAHDGIRRRNPAESGSGYALDYADGVLAVTLYSYTTAGAPIWYLASGPVTNNVFSSTLDKYQRGQCISCAYRPTAINGNDGNVSITFTSPTSANMTLPGGRSLQITK
jgi:hypothetical protein